jgi:hypothetical protein
LRRLYKAKSEIGSTQLFCANFSDASTKVQRASHLKLEIKTQKASLQNRKHKPKAQKEKKALINRKGGVMALPVLEELKQELARVYSAGSNLAKGDPRLLKYLPALAAMGQKAPVFNSLAAKLKTLCEEEENSQENLMDLGIMLYSILYTQSASPNVSAWTEVAPGQGGLPPTSLPYSKLMGVFDGMGKRGSASLLKLDVLVKNRQHNDPRLYVAYCRAISKESTVLGNYVENEVIPTLGKPIVPFLKDELAKSDGKRANKLEKLRKKLS